MEMRDPTEVERALETGYPWKQRAGLRCRECGGTIGEEEEYYDVYGVAFCSRCMKEMKRYA